MCGIVGYIGNKNTKEILLEGLKELEYRGYDSAGIAVLQNGTFSNYKAVGKLVNLEEKTKDFITKDFAVGIGHTRWATHGKPTELNAHPHLGESSYVVHNGIIENYAELKKELIERGVNFLSQTDTEVIVHQFEKNLKTAPSPFEAFAKTIGELQGAYAILLVTKSQPETIYFAKHGSPMIVGINAEGEKYFASSDTPLIGHCTDVHYFQDGDYGYVTPKEIAVFSKNGTKTHPRFQKLSTNKLSAQKEGYRFFMEKEIYEQSVVIADTLMGRISDKEV
ncbi:MAG: glutamine--fructose-6-phosphate transaminase (isomerizing), partial [Sulfurimonadaceae bacterium]